MAIGVSLPSWQKLSTKLVGALVGFLMLALMAIASTLFLSWQLEGSAAAINETGSLRMHTYRLTMLLSRQTDEAALATQRVAIEQELQTIDSTIAQLQKGDPQRPLFLPPTQKIQEDFTRIVNVWTNALRPSAVVLVARDVRQAAGWADFQTDAERFVSQVNALVHVIEQDSETRTFWLRASQLGLLAMAMVGTVSIIYLMFLLIIAPVTRLHDGMNRMKDKDFEVRLQVDSEDEFGELARGFNQMADRLQALYGNLEDRVQVKTATLESQNRELALLYDSAAFLQGGQALEPLCEGFMTRLRAYFHADAGSVRVLDPKRGNVHMVVHQGLSEDLVESERCLKVGDCLCGESAKQKVSVVHDMRRIDRAHHLQCHREGFETVSIFHIMANQQHVGLFNLHFRKAKVFSKREHALLDTLGQLLGVAILNLRMSEREREMAIFEERKLVAQGLHDSIAQGLNFLNLQVQMLDESVKEQRFDEVADIVPALRAGVVESYDDVRELLLNFRTRLVEGDLVASLQITVDKFQRQTGIEATLLADIDGAPFPREQQLQLLFIVQEALSNIRKHAEASEVEICLSDGEFFSLTIQDDGIGFDAETLLRKGDSHVGIHIMRERAERIEASFEVQSTPGTGTTVILKLPRAQRRAA